MKIMMKNTIIVNLFGGPGCGKSTTAAWIFAQLKMNSIDCEYVTEFAKDKIWESNEEVFKCQFYITGKQIFKITRCIGKVDVIITDSPMAIGIQYTDNEYLKQAILHEFNKYNSQNFNILLKRNVKYDSNGRNQSEEEAKKIDDTTKEWLDANLIDYIEIESNEDGYKNIIDIILTRLKNDI